MARDRRKSPAPPPPPADVKPAHAEPIEDMRPAEGFTPEAVLGDEGLVRKPDDDRAEEKDFDHPLRHDPALRDAKSAADEIARLRAELAALKGAGAGALPGGKFTISWKDGPTVTVRVLPGETPMDALGRHGVHSTPHKLEVHEAPGDAVCGQHLPNGSVRPFAGGSPAPAAKE